MKDGLNQVLHTGDKVIRCGGKSVYAGVKVWQVLSMTTQMVMIRRAQGHAETRVFPDTLVVVNKLLEARVEQELKG